MSNVRMLRFQQEQCKASTWKYSSSTANAGSIRYTGSGQCPLPVYLMLFKLITKLDRRSSQKVIDTNKIYWEKSIPIIALWWLINNKGKHKREVSPLSHSKVPNGYPSRSTGKGSNQRHSPNLVSSPEVTRSRSRQERDHNTGDTNGFDHPVSSSPRLVKRLFKTHSED